MKSADESGRGLSRGVVQARAVHLMGQDAEAEQEPSAVVRWLLVWKSPGLEY